MSAETLETGAAEEKAATVDPSTDEKLKLANDLVRNHMYGAAAIGILPMPAVDFVGLTALQLNLLRLLSKVYGVKFSQDLAKKAIGSLVAGYAPVALALPVASVVKMIPILGQAASAVTMPVVAGASTYAMGKVFVQHFDSGGTLLNFDPAAVREYYRAQYEQGKAEVGNRPADAT